MTSLARLPQLRVTVNSRCGRSCFFCRPSGEAISTHANIEISPDALVKVCTVFANLGCKGVKLTGGDPALWPGVTGAVRRLKSQAGMAHVEVISRHPRIGELAGQLKAAGVDLFNVSLDTTDPGLHEEITGVNDLHQVIGAMQQCVRIGVPVKVNMVVMAGVNEHEILSLVQLCEELGITYLKLLDVIRDLEQGTESYGRRLRHLRGKELYSLYYPMAPVIDMLRPLAVQERILNQGGLGHPMRALRLQSGLEVIVKDHTAGAWYGDICAGCRHYPCHDALMAIRLTADLRLQFGLLREEVAVDLKPYMDTADKLENQIRQALAVYEGATFHSSQEEVGI